MRVCIVGCGAIGSLFAAHLAQVDGVEVWAYDLVEPHVEAINRDGLRLVGEAELAGRLQATTNVSEIPAADFGVVAVKSMFTESAISATAHVFGRAAVASVQNGVGNEETIARSVERVIRRALTGLTHGRVCELPELRRLVSALVDEGKAVADSLGITLDGDPDELVDAAAEVAYEHRASMLQDVLARRPTEVDAMNGGIAMFGRGQGVPTPLNVAVAALIKGVEQSWNRPP
jgi:ketopantoate reductase